MSDDVGTNDLRPLKYAFVFGIGALILFSTWRTRNAHSAFSGFVDLAQLVALVLIAVLVLWSDRRDARRFPMQWPFLATIAAVSALVVWAAIKGWTAWKEGRPDLVRAGQFQDFNGSSLDLKVDGSYRYCDIVLGEDCCWGIYVLHNDTIDLLSADGCRSGKAVFVPCGMDPTEKCIRWIGANSGAPDLRIHVDRRAL